MHKFDLYMAGLYYATVEFSEKQILIDELDLRNGGMKGSTPLSDEANQFYTGIFNLNLKALGELLPEVEESELLRVCSGKLSGGQIYMPWTEDNPYGSEIWVQRNCKFPMDLTFEQGRLAAVTVPCRDKSTVLVKKGYESSTILKQWEEYAGAERDCLIDETKTCRIPMKDGIKLSASVILPKDFEKPLSTVLVRTPYGKEAMEESYYGFVRRGYAVVIQDVRGRNESEGEWNPMVHEQEDGDDTINWIAKQPWSDGKVSMFGGSYLGYVQWAAASTGNPHLKTLVSFVASGTAFADLPRKGGTMNSGTLAWGFAMSQKKCNMELMLRDDWDEVMKIRPMSDICKKALGYSVPFLENWFENTDDSPLWQSMDWTLHQDRINASALIFSGWYDDNGMGTTQALDATAGYEQGKRKVILGPWVHSGNANRDLHGVPMGNNALRYDVDLIVLKWLDYHLQNVDNGIEKTPMVEYYTVRSNQWKTAENWPVPNAEKKCLYFGSAGSLLESPEETSGRDTYDYDPSDETPYLVDVSENEFGVPGNYKEVDLRDDVLVYETEPLTEEMTITGDMTVEFFAGSSAPDTDWVIKAEHVDPEGNAIKMTDGFLCAKYRNGFADPQFMEDGQVYLFTVRTGKISDSLMPGHRLRLTVTSSASGLCFPNSNTEKGFNSEEIRTAENRIYFGGKYPSKVTFLAEK